MDYKDITIDEIHQMLAANERDRQFGIAVTTQPDNPDLHPINRGLNTDNVLREFMMDPYCDGWVVQYPGPIGVVIQQPRRSYFYRGESELYPTTMSSLGRALKEVKTEEGKLVEGLVAELKCVQFANLIQPMENVRAFEEIGVTVQYGAIAQHYGFKTCLMDITSDFEVALFFACCKFRNGEWHPLTLADTETQEEKKYGIIFRRAMMPWSILPNERHPIFPIGYQPFIRCSNQTGYTIEMGKNDDLKTMNLSSMEMLRFRHNPELSQWIYDKMDGGNKIYSKEDVLVIIADKLHDFVKSTVIDETALSELIQHNENFNGRSIDEWRRLLVENGYTVGSNPLTLSEEEEAKISQQLAGFDIQQFYGIKIRYRKYYNGPIVFDEEVESDASRI